MKYDVVIKQIDGFSGLELMEVTTMYSYLKGTEGCTFTVEAKEHECVALGFVTPKTEARLEYNLEPLKEKIAEILDDMELEREDCSYTLEIEGKQVSVLMKYNY